jgi:hypothetical protein
VTFDLPDVPLYQEAAFYIEPRDRAPESELQRVALFRRELRKALPSAWVAAVPNAAKRGQAAARRAKAEGMATGFPDMLVFHGSRIAFLEWKNGKDMPSDAQIERMNRLHEAGHVVACVRTWRGAFGFLQSHAGWPL